MIKCTLKNVEKSTNSVTGFSRIFGLSITVFPKPHQYVFSQTIVEYLLN